MSARERDRLKVIAELAKPPRGGRPLTQAQAAELLDCSERHVRRLLKAYREMGDAAIVHQARGRPSNRRLSDTVRQEAIRLLREHYPDFGPSLAAEKLEQVHGIQVSREALRKFMIEEGLWKPKPRKAKHRAQRDRKACFGMLVQIDTSIHDWFEGRGEKAVLIALIDDATSLVYMCFFSADSTETNMTLLRDYIAAYGRPMAIYGDKASHFRVNRPATVEEELDGQEPETQIERALRELDISYITAHSPQAKGRVERLFGTLQDRLVKELRLADISTIQEANAFLCDHYLPAFNERFTVDPACEADAHRPFEEHDIDAIFSTQERRHVNKDYTIQFHNQRYQIRKASAAPGLVGGKVIVEKRLGGSLHLRWQGAYLQFKKIEPPAAVDAAVLPLGLRPRSRTAREGTAVTPRPDHPWKRSFKAQL